METKDTPQDKTIGSEPPEEQPATDGTEPATSDSEAPAAEPTDGYGRARQELQEAVSRLRYELSKLDVEAARQRARTWVEENPTLAVFLALGAGIVAGRVLSQALRPAPPPPLSERLFTRGRSLATQARHVAHDIGESVAEHTADAGDLFARRAGEATELIRRRARELGETVAQHAGDLASAAVDRAHEWGSAASRRSHDMAEELQDSAHAAARTVRRNASHASDFAESAFLTAQTVLAAFLVKKVTDWIRRGK